MPHGPLGPGVERLTGVRVLRRHPFLHLRRVSRLQPAVGVGHLHAVEDVDDVVAPGRRRRGHRVGRQPRPMLGRLPWLALERRIRAFFFLVFLDIRGPSLRVAGTRRTGPQAGRASSMAVDQLGRGGRDHRAEPGDRRRRARRGTSRSSSGCRRRARRRRRPWSARRRWGGDPGPLTSIFSNIGNVTPYVVEQNVAISSADAGLLATELVAREAEHAEASIAVRLLQLLEAGVLRRQAAARRHVDEQEGLGLRARRGWTARRRGC